MGTRDPNHYSISVTGDAGNRLFGRFGNRSGNVAADIHVARTQGVLIRIDRSFFEGPVDFALGWINAGATAVHDLAWDFHQRGN